MTSSDTLFRLDGQVAVVTGGMGRLGSQYVRAFITAGASVVVVDLPGRENPHIVELVEARQPVTTHGVDATDRAAVDAVMRAANLRFGPVTVLVNNAGLGSSPANASVESRRFEEYPESAWDDMMESHLKSAFVVSQSFIAQYRTQFSAQLREAHQHDATPGGSIINVSSTYGLVSPDQSMYAFKRRDGREYYKPVGYSVAKSGVLNFTRWLAEYCAPFGVRANTLVPGGVREDQHDPEFIAEYVKRTPLGRMAEDDDYNGAVLFLASRASAYMTGATLVVDGGWTAR